LGRGGKIEKGGGAGILKGEAEVDGTLDVPVIEKRRKRASFSLKAEEKEGLWERRTAFLGEGKGRGGGSQLWTL